LAEVSVYSGDVIEDGDYREPSIAYGSSGVPAQTLPELSENISSKAQQQPETTAVQRLASDAAVGRAVFRSARGDQ
jgi:hypothetical protein